MEDFLTGKKHVHFIGIGGSGMYPLAQKRYAIWEYPYIWDREPKI